MLLSKEQLSAAMFASTDESQFALQHIKVDPDGTVWASNGHIAVRITRTDTPSENDFPLMDMPAEAKSPSASVLIPATTALAVIKSLPKPRVTTTLPILSNALLRVTDTHLYLGTTDLESPRVLKVQRPDGTYPNTEQIYADAAKQTPSPMPVGFNANYLNLVTKLQGVFETGHNRPIKVQSYGPVRAATFEWTAPGYSVLALVMPCRC